MAQRFGPTAWRPVLRAQALRTREWRGAGASRAAVRGQVRMGVVRSGLLQTRVGVATAAAAGGKGGKKGDDRDDF